MKKFKVRLTLLRSAFTFKCALILNHLIETAQASSAIMSKTLQFQMFDTAGYPYLYSGSRQQKKRMLWYKRFSALQRLQSDN